MEVGDALRRVLAPLGRAMSILAGLLACSAQAAPLGAATDPLRIVTFGTSLTANGAWQEPLAAALERCLERPVEIDNRARAGAASDWGRREAPAAAAMRPDIVLVEFAANDSALDRRISVSESTANMRAILGAFREANPGIVAYVMTMNPFSGPRSWMRPWRDSYEDAHRALAGELALGYIDHRPRWGEMARSRRYLSISDGLHPSPGAAASVVVPNIMRHLTDDGLIACSVAPHG